MKTQYIRALVQREDLAPEKPIVFIASTPTVKATDGLILDQAGWDLERYRSNPVVIWAHDYTRLVIGRVTDMAVEGDALRVTIEFDRADPFAAEVERKIRDGFLNAVSVGFRIDWDALEIPKAGSGEGDRAISRKQELLEISVVPVPSDPTALVESRHLGRQLLEACQLTERAGAVLSGRNKTDLEQAAELIAAVLARAAKEDTEDAPPAEDPERSADTEEVVWAEVATAMVSLLRAETDEPEDARRAEYDRLALAYRRLGRTPPELLPVEQLRALGEAEIRGLFLEGEIPPPQEDPDAGAAIAALDALLALRALPAA